MIVENETIMYKNVVWHSYEIHNSQFEKAVKDFNEKLVEANLTIVGPLFYGLKNIPDEEILAVDIYMPVEQSYIAEGGDLNFQSYFYIDDMIMTRVKGDVEVNTESVFDEFLRYAIDKDYAIVSPIFHIIRGDDETQWVELKAKVFRRNSDDF